MIQIQPREAEHNKHTAPRATRQPRARLAHAVVHVCLDLVQGTLELRHVSAVSRAGRQYENARG
jgi:hypothetical protein